MSSPANNNLPLVPPLTGSVSPATRQPQRPANDPIFPTSTQHSRRGRSSRGGRSSASTRPTNRVTLEVASEDGEVVKNVSNPADSSQLSESPCSSHHIGTSGEPAGSRNRPKNQKYTRGAGGGGKYKQRQQLDQLMDSMQGLDIDLAESIVPSGSHPRNNASGKTVHPTSTRKVNLTHLLNHDRRQRGGRHRFNSSSCYELDRYQPHHHHTTYYRDSHSAHKFNKQQFLQANCQFVVLPFHDYSIHKVNPDWPIDWDCIEEVKFRQTNTTKTTCPICLDPPVAAKITRCGHIYCWTCMLHYLSLSDKKHRSCPICFENISEPDLRSVVPKFYTNHIIDEEITMQLMVRKKGCVEVEPYSIEHNNHTPNEISGSEANLLIVNPDIIIEQVLNREQDELMLKLELDKGEPEVCFVEQAIEKLSARGERLRQLSMDPTKKYPSRDQRSQEYKSEKCFLFYQSSDGQHIYLNPFSTKILCHEYGCLENCPQLIRANILQMDWISMSESWRRRFKYLEHLPLTCEFRLLEIDFEASNLVSQETFLEFRQQIKLRAQDRANRKTEELKRDKIIQIEQDRRIYGIQPTLDINLDNEEHFPSVIDESRLTQLKQSRATPDQLSTPQDLEVNDGPDDSAEQSSAPLSFREIQERQAAESKKSVELQNSRGSWASQGTNTKSAPSSFAKLLVNAKSSKKQWTQNPITTRLVPSTSGIGAVQQAAGVSTDPDAENQELRAPPYNFTINDFLVEKKPARRPSKRK